MGAGTGKEAEGEDSGVLVRSSEPPRRTATAWR